MWLNDKGLNIRCFRMIPYKNGIDILVDVQQIIPLLEAEDYQIKIREQKEEKKVSMSKKMILNILLMAYLGLIREVLSWRFGRNT